MLRKKLLLIILLIVGCVFATTNDRYKFIPYVSPGIQFGYTFNEGLFYGFQFSLGFGIPLDNSYHKYAIPALSFGITQSFHNMKLKNKLVKKYSDLQITYFTKYDIVRWGIECVMPGLRDCPETERFTFFPPVGIGIGKINKEKSSDYRLKVYVSFISNLTYNYELQSKLHSLSLIPVLSLPLKKLSY